MQVVLDERETQLIQRFSEIIGTNQHVEMERQMLPLGDVLIRHGDKEIFLIERKTLTDLIASIKDGRYEEQSYRFCHSVPIERHHIIYILEGPMSSLKTEQEKKMVYSSIIKLHAFKGFTVIRTTGVLDTCDYIFALCDKTFRELQRSNSLWSTQNTSVEPTKDYCSVIKKVKKENITKENIDEILLCQIPSVNNVSAKAVLENFGSIFGLMSQIRKDPQCLNSIVIESKGKKRKLAKNVIQNIVHYLGD
jgi:ERCC4-type nuclease